MNNEPLRTDASRPLGSLWAHVHALTVLGEAGSYTAAARRLGLSKAAMSLRISELEAAAGVPLVLHEPWLARMEAFYAQRSRPMPPGAQPTATW